MDVPELDSALSNQLTAEFGVYGKSAVDSLATAQVLLGIEPGLLPRHGATVAYCLRDALVEIPRASGVGDEGRRNALSEAVVDSASQYRDSLELSDDEIQIARQAMFSHIDDLQAFLNQPVSVHQVRLTELFRQRSGTELLSSDAALLHVYERLRRDCNHAGHHGCTLDEARRLWSECLELLRRLFLAHESDTGALERLARLEDPSDTDFEQLMGQAVTQVDLDSFLRHIQNPCWLWQLAHSNALQAPGSMLWWTACTAAVDLSASHPDEVLRWLKKMHAQQSADATHVRCIAYASRRIGGAALDLLLRIVRRHPTDERIAIEGLNGALELEATHPQVVEFADVLLNEHSWSQLHIADKLAARVADGVNEGNSLDRIERMCLKLHKTADDVAISTHRLFPSGTMENAHEVFRHDRASVMLGCVTRMLRSAWDWHSASALLACIHRAPDAVRDRLRAWILANAADVDPEALVAEVSEAITQRDATGDDVALIDRALELGDRDVIRARWLSALGDAPDIDFVQRAITDQKLLPENLWRARSWIPVLPEGFAGTWAAPCQVLSDTMGEISREQMLKRNLPQMREIGSPMDAQHFEGISPSSAATTIARWRPDSADFYVSARGLGKVLQEVIAANPAAWLSDPLGIVTTLRHPTYISAYLRAVDALEDKSVADPSRLLDVASLVVTEPWPAAPIGRDRHRYEPDWTEARRAAIELIGTIAASGTSFSDRHDEAWGLIENAARPQLLSGEAPSDHDQMALVEVSASARALELAVLFVDAELNASRPLRPEFEQLLEHSLRLDGDLGIQHRIVIGSNISWLRHRLPEWTASAMDLFIGSEAPDGLGETTFIWLLRRNPPRKWLCEDYSERLYDSARRQEDPALAHVLVAMLWGWSGYNIEAVAAFLQRHPNLLPEAAERLAKLLGGDEVDQGHLAVGIRLWEVLLESTVASSLVGFGWMSIVTALDEVLWSELTRRTIEATHGRLDWDQVVADRAMAVPLSADKLAILDLLVRHTPSDWVPRCIADNAAELLGAGPGLSRTDEYLRLRTALLSHGFAAAQ